MVDRALRRAMFKSGAEGALFPTSSKGLLDPPNHRYLAADFQFDSYRAKRHRISKREIERRQAALPQGWKRWRAHKRRCRPEIIQWRTRNFGMR